MIYKDKQRNELFKKIKSTPEEAKKEVHTELLNLLVGALMLEPFLPRTSAKILECIRENKMPEKALFGRLP